MFHIPPFSDAPPISVEEALEQARRLLARASIHGAEVTVTRPAAAGECLKGACLEGSLPLTALEAALREAADAVAASQGVKVSRTKIHLENRAEGDLSLALTVEVDVRVFGATITLRVRGALDATDGESVRLQNLQLDAGTGLFSGMATGLIRPRLEAMEGQRIDLTRLAGVSVRLLCLECSNGTPEMLRIEMQFV